MPPARQPLRALGSLQLVGYANNPNRVITELAFIADARVNTLVEGVQSDLDAPLEVQFEEFMNGVNSRGKGTKTRQRKMTVEQAAAVLLVAVQKGHVELIPKTDDPQTIDVIRVLPEAKRILAAFLPKLRGYGDIPYEQQYRGAIALSRRHFFPKGKPLTKKELMALLLQSYQEKRELNLKCQTQSQPTKTLGIQTSLESVDNSRPTSGESAPRIHLAMCTNTVETPTPIQTNSQGNIELTRSDLVEDVGPTMASELDSCLDHGDNHDSEPDPEPIQLITCTPVASRSFNPYMTPVSNSRHVDPTAPTSSLLNTSPTPAIGNHTETTSSEEGSTDEGIGELLQATATSQGRLNYYYIRFLAACQKESVIFFITFLEGQKEEIQREFDLTKRKLDETEQRLREADVDKFKLKKWVDSLLRRVDSIYKQLGLLRGMADPDAINAEEWSVYDPESHEGFDTNSI